MRVQALVMMSFLLGACAGGERATADLSGAITAVDSTGDTVRVTVNGDPPPERIRRTVEQLRVGTTADDTSLFAEVFEFEVDRSDRIWVFDQPGNRIFLFGADGALIRTIGRQGAGPGEFQRNGGMTPLPDGGIALWDPSNARVSIFAENGDFVRSLVTPSGFSTNDGLHSDRDGSLYLKRPVTPRRSGDILGRLGLVKLDSAGKMVDSLVPVDLNVPREVYQASNKGSMAATGSRYTGQYLWTWSPEGYFVVANGANYEVLVAPPGARPVQIKRQVTLVALTDEQRTNEEEQVLWQMRSVDPSWTWNGPPIPRTAPPLDAIQVARDGRIWVRVPTAVERIPDDQVTPSRDKARPTRRFRIVHSWEVFEPSGRFLGRVQLPPMTTLIQADGNRVWVVARDENDLPAVVRLGIEPAF